ncbi:MAG: metal ABC transporter ATP-binding protein [Bacillota bacterium]|nr:metal ABC transporter ATP-binding protein [Bacillota bacterium]
MTFSYSREPLFHRLDFAVAAGDFVALVGPNGGGKSTLVKLGVGLLRPLEGVVRLFGQEVSSFRQWNRIGYVPQHIGAARMDFPITVEEVVALGRVPLRPPGRRLTSQDRHVIDHTLEAVGMSLYRRRLLQELSGGQRQRTFVARALAANPDLIILDEPTAGIDPAARESLYRLLATLNQNLGVTVLLVSHDVEQASAYARRLALVEGGRVRPVAPEDLRGKWFWPAPDSEEDALRSRREE